MRVGVTFFVQKEGGVPLDIWSNGIVQNIFFLYRLLKSSPAVTSLFLINCGDGETISSAMLGGQDIPLQRFNDADQQLDVLIEAGAQILPHQAQAVHARGGVVITYKCGNDYVIDSERILFGKPPGVLFNGTQFDEVWTHPQHARSCSSYWGVPLRAPVRVVPHLWDPYFLNRAAAALAKRHQGAVLFSHPAMQSKRAQDFASQLPEVLGPTTAPCTSSALPLIKRGFCKNGCQTLSPT